MVSDQKCLLGTSGSAPFLTCILQPLIKITLVNKPDEIDKVAENTAESDSPEILTSNFQIQQKIKNNL